jgi:hypothetical protein
VTAGTEGVAHNWGLVEPQLVEDVIDELARVFADRAPPVSVAVGESMAGKIHGEQAPAREPLEERRPSRGAE